MIDKTGEYWVGDKPNDIDEYLRNYSEDEGIDIKPVICENCRNTVFGVLADQDEGAIAVKCQRCGQKKILLDCEEVYEDAEPVQMKCPVCKQGKEYNVKVGFIRRENGSVKWVYIGNRCVNCGALGSFLDWKIDYEPTDEMERNI